MATALLLASAAEAQPVSSQQPLAQSYVQNGMRLYGEGRFADAARAFREAHAITHRPELLFNLGMALERAGELQNALDTLVLFEAAGAPGFDRARLQPQIAALRQRIADEASARERAAQGAVAPAQPAQPAQPATAEPPPRLIEVVVTRRVEVRYVRSTGASVGPWITLGLGGLVLITGGVMGLATAAMRSDVDQANMGQVPWSADLTETVDNYNSARRAAQIFTGVGLAGVVGGVVWLILRGPGQRREVPIASASVIPVQGGAVVGFGGAL